MKRTSRIELLRSVWLFERCSRAELITVESSATQLGVPAGKVLAREGEIGREFFVLVTGTALATRAGEKIATLEPGEFFGEMALLDCQPRTATVETLEQCELLVLSAREFATVVETMPAVDRRIMTVLARRLRELENRFLPVEERLLTRQVS